MDVNNAELAQVMPVEDAAEFITRVQHTFDPATNIFLVRCSYDETRFQPSDFARLGISMPESITRSVRKRQAEFLAGRFAAARALAELLPGWQGRQGGEGETDIPIGSHRHPIWPEGIAGSISHGAGGVVCALSHVRHNEYLGVDIEARLTENTCAEVRDTVLTASELSLLMGAGLDLATAVTLAFSAKESLFKALFPKVGEYFGFEVARVSVCDLRSGTLDLILTPPFMHRHQLQSRYQCRFSSADGRVQTLIAGCFTSVTQNKSS